MTQNQALSFDISRILQLLPHRYPFLLVDRVVEFVVDDYIKTYKMAKILYNNFKKTKKDYFLFVWLYYEYSSNLLMRFRSTAFLKCLFETETPNFWFEIRKPS